MQYPGKTVIFTGVLILFFIFSAHVSSSQSILNEKALEWAKKSYESVSASEYEDAIDFATKALALEPDLISSYINRSWAYSELGSYENAIEDCNKAISLDPDNALAFNNRGLAYQRIENIEKASADYGKACDLGLETACDNLADFKKEYTPEPPIVAQSEVEIQRNNHTESAESPTHSLENADGQESVTASRSEDSTIHMLDESVESTVQRPPSQSLLDVEALEWATKGYESVSTGKYHEAIEFASKALSIKPDLVNSYINRSWAYSETGLYDLAIEDCNKVISLEPDNALAFNNRGLAYQRIENIEKATLDYGQACNLGLETACDNLAVLNAETAPEPPAVAQSKTETEPNMLTDNSGPVDYYLTEAFDAEYIKPHISGPVNYNLAEAFEAEYIKPPKIEGSSYHIRNEDLDYSALELLSQSLISDEALEWAIRSYESVSAGEYDEAIEFASKAIDLEPGLINNYINRSWAYSEKGFYENAIEDSDKAISLDPENFFAFNNRGLAYHRMDNIERALEDYNIACDLGLETACDNLTSLERESEPELPAIAYVDKRSLTVPQGAGGSYNLRVKSFKELQFSSVVRQQHDFSCGSASVATLLSYHYDQKTSEQEVFTTMFEKGDQDKIRKQGFSLLDIKKYLEFRGYSADGYRLSLDKLARLSVPAITLINTNNYLHIVVIKAVNDQDVLIGDPARGLRKIARTEFESNWNGILLLIKSDAKLARAHFNTDKIWKSQPGAPLSSALNRTGLANFNLSLPVPGELH